MITIKTEKIKSIASKVAIGVDDNKLSPVSELLELEVKNGNLTFKTTNKEYFLNIKVNGCVNSDADDRVTTMATDFLRLVSKITTNEISLEMNDQVLTLITSGRYSLPLVLDGDNCATLPSIGFDGMPTTTFNVDGKVLKSILDINSKEVQNNAVTKTIQKYYYWDNQAALTFVESACINEFNIAENFKILLPPRIVSLFKVFDDNVSVKVEILKIESGKDYQDQTLYQNRIRFSTNDIELICHLPSDEEIEKYPEIAIKELGSDDHPGEVVIEKKLVLDALSRLLLFESSTGDIKRCGEVKFDNGQLQILCLDNSNVEFIPYKSSPKYIDYTSYLSLKDLFDLINIPTSDDINLFYGGGDLIMLKRNNVKIVLPEMNKPQ